MGGERAVGIALWEPPTPLGVTVQVAYLADGAQSTAAYQEFYREIADTAGPIVLAPGGLAGLTDVEERSVMEALGFAPFARIEMRLAASVPLPAAAGPPPSGLRSCRPAEDEPPLARLHQRAYEESFDRFLFLSDLDPTRDADMEMRAVIDGRWGEFLPGASWVVERPDGVVAAALVVRAPYGPLVADVMVAPDHRGQGFGRAVLLATVRALRERGEPTVVLNVTAGNAPAVHLYESLGFVPSLGPSHGWYSPARIPFPPGRR